MPDILHQESRIEFNRAARKNCSIGKETGFRALDDQRLHPPIVSFEGNTFKHAVGATGPATAASAEELTRLGQGAENRPGGPCSLRSSAHADSGLAIAAEQLDFIASGLLLAAKLSGMMHSREQSSPCDPVQQRIGVTAWDEDALVFAAAFIPNNRDPVCRGF